MNNWLFRLLQLVLGQITPTLRERLCSFFAELHAKAAETQNPWDDLLTGLLLDIFSCPPQG